MQPMTWNHDMAAAPRDGTRVLLAWPSRYDYALHARWSKKAEGWYVMGHGVIYANAKPPSAWMPLPPLPEVTRCRS